MTDMLNTLEQADAQLLLFLNGFHNSYWDYFMMMYSSRFVWIPFYASFLYVMFRNYDWRSTTKSLVAIIAIVVLCDQTTSGLIKPMVERLRPSNTDNPISPMVHIVNNYRGGRYGFPSSHAANAWGMVFFAMYLARNRKLNLFLLAWAIVMAYSRAYMGVHYPGDILVGIFFGALYATLCYYLLAYIDPLGIEQWKTTGRQLHQSWLPITMGSISVLVMLTVAAFMAATKMDIFFN